MPSDGLILDVRGNGGGYVYVAEALLQSFTPRRIQPEPTQFINTPVTAALCAKVKDLNAWSDSISESIETGALYSAAIPLYGDDSDEAVNETGQLYHGPVVLVTDALCYSATDTFAAGFQDHQIGTVLGADDNTGAGGANVWEFTAIMADWPDGPFKPLPAGARFRVALRRTLRVGKRWGGQPVEDLGIIPDVRYQMTRRDLLEGNADLMEKAGEVLAQGTPRTLDVTVTSRDDSAAQLAVTTAALTSLDVYVDGRPVTRGQGARRHQHGHGPAERPRPRLGTHRRVRRRGPGRRGHRAAGLAGVRGGPQRRDHDSVTSLWSGDPARRYCRDEGGRRGWVGAWAADARIQL